MSSIAASIAAPQDARGPLEIAWLAPDGSRMVAGDVVIRLQPIDALRHE